MKIDTFFRHFREAVKSLARNNWMTFAAVSAVSVTLLIFGLFLVFAFNLSFMASELDKQVSIRVSLSPQITADQIDNIRSQIEQDSKVKSVEFISKEEGLQMMKQQWGDDKEFLEGLEKDNPLPDTLQIQPSNPQETEALAKDLQQSYPNYIEHVDHGEGVSDRLLNLSAWIRNMVLVFGLGLAVLAAFLISNTIKLTIFARRREIEIMRLVGASNWFIRWPFFIEGGVIGVLGAIVPVTVVLLGYNAVVGILDADKAYSFFKLLGFWDIAFKVTGLTTLLGILIGIWGSLISIRRFLRT